MGVESGDDSILHKIGKGVTSQQIIEAGQKIKEAGILLSVTVLLGLGGAELSHQHALATASSLTALDPDFGGALTLTLIPELPWNSNIVRVSFRLFHPCNRLQELKTIIENLDLLTVFSARCMLPTIYRSEELCLQDKAQMLSQLDYVLSREDPSLLRPEFMRGL